MVEKFNAYFIFRVYLINTMTIIMFLQSIQYFFLFGPHVPSIILRFFFFLLVIKREEH